MHSYSYHDTPERSGVKYPVDIVPEKQGKDIIIGKGFEADRIKEQTVHQKMVIDTWLVEPDEGQLALTFRSTLVMDDDVRYLKSVHLELNHNESF